MAGESDKTVNISISMPESTLDLLEAFVAHLKSQKPEYAITRGSIITAAVSEYIKRWATRTLPEYRNSKVLESAYRALTDQSS